MMSPRILLIFVAILLATVAAPPDAHADVSLLSPTPGLIATANPCPVAPCTAPILFEADVSGAPFDSAVLVFTPDSGGGFTQPLCSPPDPIEGIPGCPATPFRFSRTLMIREGQWNVIARITRGAAEETTAPVPFTVLPASIPSAGPVGLSEVLPNRGNPGLRVREPSPAFPDGIITTPGEVEIIGQNLDNNPFLRVYLAPKAFLEPELAEESGLPLSDWCLFEAEIVDRQPLGGGDSKLVVNLPELPLEARTKCGVSPGPKGNIFTKNWRWVIRDPWIRPERVHDAWAIPSPRLVPWHDAPSFKLVKPAYPHIDGFGFENQQTDAKYKEFLTVFGNNAYHCVDCVPFVGCACLLPRIPDPIYHLLWWPIYSLVIDDTGGSCNGMSATSLLMAREELETEDVNPDVLFPIGFTVAGDPAAYKDTNFCTPLCSPPKPDNLWATIRMNHGVQISREFLLELLDTLGEAIFDPDDLTSIKGVPNATLERVRDNPRGHVLCFFKVGGGHCVTPYRVEGNRIWIYDNNEPDDASRFIDIVGGDYDYPLRTEEPNGGNAIVAFPIGIWQEGRHLLGLGELSALISGDIVSFLYMISVGDADMVVSNETGGRWGFEDDGTFSDSLIGAVSLPPLGPPPEDVRQMPLLLAMNQPTPTVQINADGGHYYYHAGAGGHLLQLEATDAIAGDKDRIQLGYTEDALGSIEFTPQRDASHLVPRVGLEIAEGESAVFNWLGLEVPGGKTVGFGADKEARAVRYRNDTGAPTQHILALDFGAGEYGRMIYGPFEIPDGAEQRVVLASWPDVTTVVSEIDFDRDGMPERSETHTGRPASPPTNVGRSADLSVENTVPSDSIAVDESVAYRIVVSNNGPEDATDITLVNALTGSPVVSSIEATNGLCMKSENSVTCALGDLLVGETAMVNFVATPTQPGTLVSGATVFGSEGDPDSTNNSAVLTVQVTEPEKDLLWWVIVVIAVTALLLVAVYLIRQRRS